MNQTRISVASAAGVLQTSDAIHQILDQALNEDNQDRLIGSDVLALVATSAGQRTPRLIVAEIALLSDCLRVAHEGALADGRLSLILPLLSPVGVVT